MLKNENPLAGTEFFSMHSNLNDSLQRELDSLHEKFNKLDAKFRKERSSRKNKSSRKKQQQEEQEENDYEYEYVDESLQTPPVDETVPMNPLCATRQRGFNSTSSVQSTRNSGIKMTQPQVSSYW